MYLSIGNAASCTLKKTVLQSLRAGVAASRKTRNPKSEAANPTANTRKLEMGLGGFVLGSPILYLKGMRILMFQLSGFYYSLIIGFRVNPNSSNLQSNPTAPNTLVSLLETAATVNLCYA